MEAPRLRSMFRNVRTEPKKFVFKSRHLPDTRQEWAERKKRVEQEVWGADADSGPAPIRFRRGGNPLETAAEARRMRRESSIRDARKAMIRALIIAMLLVWVAWEGLKWVEASDFGGALDALRGR